MAVAAVVASAATSIASAGAAHAAAQAASFAPCREQQQRGWECATVVVPLDRTGVRPGTIPLRVQRLAHAGPPRRKALVNLEGGPGAATTARSAQTRRLLGDVTARNGYELLLVDLRGTGGSGPEAIPLGTSRFYAAADSVQDLDAVRAALGLQRLALMGTSYSTLVAAEYARTLPQRTDRLILDSPLRPDGPTWFDDGPVGAASRVLADVCARGACPGGGAAVVRDFAAVARRLRGTRIDAAFSDVWRPPGRAPLTLAVTTRYTEERLRQQIAAADENSAAFALLPAALHAAARGDFRALARAAEIKRDGPSQEEQVNPDVTRITRCLDMRTPWPYGAPFEQRVRAVERAERAVAAQAIAPFTRRSLTGGAAAGCIGFGPAGLPGAIRGGAIPRVPGVILQGAWDVRTPLANGRAVAAAWPGGTLVVAPGTGHGVLRAVTPCATAAIDDLLAGRRVDAAACAGAGAVAQPLPAAGDAAPLRLEASAGGGGERPQQPGGGTQPAALSQPLARTLAGALAAVRDAEVAVAIATPRGGRALVPGLAGGYATARRTPPSLAATIALTRYALAAGVVLDGTVRSDAAGRRRDAELRLSGAHRGRLALHGRRLTGTLDGRALDVRVPRELALPGVRRYG